MALLACQYLLFVDPQFAFVLASASREALKNPRPRSITNLSPPTLNRPTRQSRRARITTDSNAQPPLSITMADSDPLLLVRQSISSSQPFHPTSDADASSPSVPLAKATHLAFPSRSLSLPITTPTRFVSNDAPVDLRSIYFAWLNSERAIPEYNAAATALNDELGDADKKVQNLGFIEKLDLITWLEGASEESDYIKPLAEGAAKESVAAKTGAQAQTSQKSGKGSLDPRLASVYSGERKMGDRNTVLRGVKPTVSLTQTDSGRAFADRGRTSRTYAS